MNKVKKFFKDCWSFYRLTFYGNNQRAAGRKFSPFAFAMVATFISAFMCLMQLESQWAFSFAVVASLLVINIGQVTYDKTSLLSVAPLKPWQRIVYSYITVILNAFFFMAIMTAVSWVVFLIIALIVFCVTGENIFVTEMHDIAAETITSANGTGVLVLFFLIIMFGGLALAHIDNSKTRTIASVAFLGLNEVICLTIVNVCGYAAQKGQGVIQSFFFSVDIMKTIDKVNHPWIILAVLGVIAAALFGVSLWLVIKRHKSTDL